MAKKKINLKKELEIFLYITSAILILFLSAFNLQNKKVREVKVLGATTETSYNDATYNDKTYWEELVKKNPTYRDAWVELGRIDKVKQIDPNYFQP